MSEERRREAITGLFEALLVSKPRPERVARFVRRTLDIPVERLERACRQLEISTERSPTIALIRATAQDLEKYTEDEQVNELYLLRYAMERYSDMDYWEFRERFRFIPSAALFRQYAITPHSDVTFREPTREECQQEREDYIREHRESLERAVAAVSFS